MGCKVFLTFLGIIQLIFAAEWGYTGSHGPDHWKDIQGSAACGLDRQSPIDIPRWDSIEMGSGLGEFVFNGYNDVITGTIKNNGHTAQVDLATPMSISGGGLDGVYKAAQFHWHWGSDDTQGSEHTVNQQSYPMELHIVHYAEKYGDITTAMVEPDGLAVLGFFYQVSAADNQEYTEVIDSLQDTQFSGTNTAVTGFSMNKLLPSTHQHFYRYLGSLTTPPCFESVIWSVFLDRIKISSSQLAKFRELDEATMANETTHLIQDNFRPVQMLKNRKVSYYITTSSAPSVGFSVAALAFAVYSLLFVLF